MTSEIFYLHRGEDYNELAELEHYMDEIKKSAQYTYKKIKK
jgi:hypothetical protein